MILAVSLPILAYFCFPERRDFIFPRRILVSVPEITVDENGDLCLGENDIRRAGQVFEMLTEPQSSSVKLRTHAGLQSRVFTLDTRHAVSTLLSRKIIHTFYSSDSAEISKYSVGPTPMENLPTSYCFGLTYQQ